MTATDFILEPIRLFSSNDLLGAGRPDLLPVSVEPVHDLERAMLLENGQDLPEGYRIWSDMVSGAVSGFYATPQGLAGRAVIAPEAERVWQERGEFERRLQVRRIRKTITPFETFWLTTAYDLFERLQSVSLGRQVLGTQNHPVLEAIYSLAAAGFYPCGWHETGRIVAFDPRSLEGHMPVSAL